VRGFAAVFTGWDWNNTGCGDDTYTCCVYYEDEGWGTYFWCGPSNYNDPPWQLPMQPVEHYHDSTSDKQLLTYPGVMLPNGVLPHGGDAQTEMTQRSTTSSSSERRPVHRDAAHRAARDEQSVARVRAPRRAGVQPTTARARAAICAR
jgi:hypothetical protein